MTGASQELRSALSSVLWVGGAQDGGKSSLARMLVDRLGCPGYLTEDYDREHSKRLARVSRQYADSLAESLAQRWLDRLPQESADQQLWTFRERFAFVIADLVRLAGSNEVVVAEGLGFLPELVAPVMADVRRGIWLVPTHDFKLDSVERRERPYGRDRLDDPRRATANFVARDTLVAEEISRQAVGRGCRVLVVDGSISTAEICEELLASIDLG